MESRWLLSGQGNISIRTWNQLRAGSLVLLIGLLARSDGASYYWDPDGNSTSTQGGSGIWNTSSNYWRPGSPTVSPTFWPGSSSDNDAIFQGTSGTLTLTVPVWVNDLYIASGEAAFSIAGGSQSLTLEGESSSVI